MPRGLGYQAGDLGIKTQFETDLLLIRDDAPGPGQPLLDDGRVGWLKRLRRNREFQDALQLERPDGAPRPVVTHQIERPRRRRGFDQVWMHARPPRRTPGAVRGRVVGEFYNAALGPG